MKGLKSMEDELVDLVNENDEIVGKVFRSKAYAENKLASLRAVWFLIKNQEGKLWIPRRQAHKKSSPNCLDGSAVGIVTSGETYEQSMIREVAEELNLNVVEMSYRSLGKLNPKQHGTISFVQAYELQVPNNFIIDYNKNDFSEFYWLSPQEILQKFEDGEKMRNTLAIIIRHFYN